MTRATVLLAATAAALFGIAGATAHAQSAAQFAFAANQSDGTLSGYRIDQATGALTPVPGSPFATVRSPNTLTVAGQGRFLYAADLNAGEIAEYAIDGTSGTLRPLPGSPFQAKDAAGGSYAGVLRTDHGGRFVFALNPGINNLSVYAVNPDTGALSVVPGSPFATGAQPLSLAVDPAGKYVYTINVYGHSISAWSMDAATGTLRPLPAAPFPLPVIPGWSPGALDFGPDGRFAYLLMRGSGGSVILSFAVNRDTGLLSPVGMPVATSPSAALFCFDPRGNFAYTVDRGFTALPGYQIDAGTGVLTPAIESPFPSDPTGYPTAMAFDASGRFAYVTSGVGRLVQYAIDADTGALQFNGAFPTGQNSTSIVLAARAASAPPRRAPRPAATVAAPQSDPNLPGPASALNLPLRWGLPGGSSIPYAWFNGGWRAESGQHARYLGFNDEGSWFEHPDDHHVYLWNQPTLALTRRYQRLAEVPPQLLATLKNVPSGPGAEPVATDAAPVAAHAALPAPHGEEPDPNFPTALAGNGQTGLPVTWTATGGTHPVVELHFDMYANTSGGEYLGFNERGSWIVAQDGKVYIWHLRTFSLLLGANRVRDIPRDVLVSLHNADGSVQSLLGGDPRPPASAARAATPSQPQPQSRLDAAILGAAVQGALAGSATQPTGAGAALAGGNATISNGVLRFTRPDGSRASYQVVRPHPGANAPGVAAGADGPTGSWLALEDGGRGILFTVRADASVTGQEMPPQLIQMLTQGPQRPH